MGTESSRAVPGAPSGPGGGTQRVPAVSGGHGTLGVHQFHSGAEAHEAQRMRRGKWRVSGVLEGPVFLCLHGPPQHTYSVAGGTGHWATHTGGKDKGPTRGTHQRADFDWGEGAQGGYRIDYVGLL